MRAATPTTAIIAVIVSNLVHTSHLLIHHVRPALRTTEMRPLMYTLPALSQK